MHILDTIIDLGKSLYHKSPPALRFVFFPARWILPVVALLWYEQWMISGLEVNNKQKLTILYVGTGKNKDYIANLAYGSSHVETYFGKRWLGLTPRAVKNNCDLFISEVLIAFHKLAKIPNDFLVPCWITGVIDISINIASLINHNNTLANGLRKIRKNALYFEITKEISQLHKFYYEMYIPYISKRWGNEAFIETYDSFKTLFRKCELLSVKQGEDTIAGSIISFNDRVPRILVVGVKDGNYKHVKDGALSAIYQFQVQHLKEEGYSCVNLGETRAFLKDGVLQYKKNWGQEVIGTSERGFLIQPLTKTEGVMEFLLNNPFIFYDGTALSGAIFNRDDQSFDNNSLKEIHHRYNLAGISKLSFFQFAKEDGNIKKIT